MFNHRPLTKITDIERIDSPSGRKYKICTGEMFESVTSWLSRIKDNSYLLEWRKSIGEKEADKIVKRAVTRGTKLHENVELFLKNEEVPKMHLFDRILFEPFADFLNSHVNNIMAIEYPLYSTDLKLAGTVDCLAEYDGELSVIDFKTSKSRKNKEDIDSYFLQTTIYAHMVEELYDLKINKIVIIMALDYENKIQVFEDSTSSWKIKLMKLLKQYPPI